MRKFTIYNTNANRKVNGISNSSNYSNTIGSERNSTKTPTKKSRSKIRFDFELRGFEHITEQDKAEWGQAYPGVDIEGEISRAGQWLLANPQRHKKNYRRFLTSWFNRTRQNPSKAEFRRAPPEYIPTPLSDNPCMICGEPASKWVQGQGYYCPQHSYRDYWELKVKNEKEKLTQTGSA